MLDNVFKIHSYFDSYNKNIKLETKKNWVKTEVENPISVLYLRYRKHKIQFNHERKTNNCFKKEGVGNPKNRVEMKKKLQNYFVSFKQGIRRTK